MNWSAFKGKSVALLGVGKENLSLVPHLLRARAKVTLCDQWPIAVSADFADKVQKRIGPNYLDGLERFDYVFRSPGLPVETVEKHLSGSGRSPIRTSVTDLFLSIHRDKTVGVTGTKGKGTTATLIASILEAAGIDVLVGGNIGVPVFDSWARIRPETVVVMELSSFQLEDVKTSPRMAVVLPITPDHLKPLSDRSPNYHRSMEEYVAAKAQIVRYQKSGDTVVYAADNTHSASIGRGAVSKKIAVSSQNRRADFFVDDDGSVFKGGRALLSLAGLGLAGRHIFLDATLAIAVATELSVAKGALERGIRDFKGLSHRLQTIAQIGGVKYVDDSYATTPEATIAALTAFKEPIILIAGGSEKGVDFSSLAETVKNASTISIILIGQEAARLSRSFQVAGVTVPIHQCDSLEEAVRLARQKAKPGSVVLLSPACASTDMFNSAAERGDRFKELVVHGV